MKHEMEKRNQGRILACTTREKMAFVIERSRNEGGRKSTNRCLKEFNKTPWS